MPIGYVVTLALVAGCTLASLVPAPQGRRLGVVVFGMSLVVNELPHLALALLLAATVLAVSQDGLLGSPAGWILLAVAAATSLGLVVVARRSRHAGPAVDLALDDGLGAGWRRSLRVQRGSWARRVPRFRALLAPYPARPRDVERVANVAYGDAGSRNQLDVYRHASRPTAAPTLVYFHGGGYSSGHKRREARALLHRLAGEGWVCVSANYRLRPAAEFPDHLIDAKKVISWVREHGREFGAGSRTMVVCGSSAGAHLAALAALTPNEPVFQPGFEESDTTVNAAICLYGYYGRYYGHLEDQIPRSAPMAYDASAAPPFFLTHGDRDSYVPVENARQFVAHLRSMSRRPVVYAELPGAQHAFDLFRSIRFLAVVDGVAAFLTWLRDDADQAAPRPEREAVLGRRCERVPLLDALDPEVISANERGRDVDRLLDDEVDSVDREGVGDGRGLHIDIHASVEVGPASAVDSPAVTVGSLE